MEEMYETMEMDFGLDEAHEELCRDIIQEELFDGKKVNSHNIKTGLQRELYRWIVNTAKQLVFENCLELLKYAVWEEKPDVILFPEKHKEKNNS